VQAAVRFKVPLIIWGHHQGLDQVGMYSHTDEVEMTRKYRKEHDLMGYEAEDLIGPDSDLSESDVIQFLYPHDKEIEKTGVRGIYLGNYIRWDSKTQHEAMIRDYGYKTAEQQRTFDFYNDVDCHHYSGIHDYIKYLKFGYGKVTDHASRDIRLGHISRDEGISLVERYSEIVPRDLPLFLEWMKMSSNEFQLIIEKFRNKTIWKKTSSDGWILAYSTKRCSAIGPNSSTNFKFQLTGEVEIAGDRNKYYLLNRGYENK
jgi:hypothetical protein